MSHARALAIALASCLLVSEMAMAEWERLSLPKYPGVTAFIDNCATTLPVSIVALQKSDLADGTAVRKVMAWAQLMAQMECPQASAIELVASVDGQQVYKGRARKVNGWLLVETKPANLKATPISTPKVKLSTKASPTAGADSVALAQSTPASPRAHDKPLHSQLVGAVAPSTSRPVETSTEETSGTQKSISLQQLRDAAEQGQSSAQVDLGRMYELGDGVAKDPVQAAALYQKASAQGLAQAQFNLGTMYQQGNGVAKNLSQAAALYQQAADQGLGMAQGALGWMYEHGQGVGEDPQKAVYWYRQAAEQGIALGEYSLATMYERGLGVAENPQETVVWLRKAAEHGHIRAQYKLALNYSIGKGVAKDQDQAVAWFRKAAEQGDMDSQYFLGMMYQEGHGVVQDNQQAIYWYRKAAAQGDTASRNGLRNLLKK